MHLFTASTKLCILNGQKSINFCFSVFPLLQIIMRNFSKRKRKQVKYMFCSSLQAERHAGHHLWIEFTMRSKAGKNILSAQLCFKLQKNFLQQLCELMHVLLEE